jgi:putative DNA primase/helicase
MAAPYPYNDEYYKKVLNQVLDCLGLHEGDGEKTITSPIRNDDTTPSFSIDTEKGLWIDHGTGEKGNAVDLAKRLDIPIPANHKPTSSTIQYPYKNEKGETVFLVCRKDTPEGKKIWQTGPSGKGNPPKLDKKPLYRLPELLKSSDPVLLVEGEKCASVEVPGYFVTTWSGGAGAVEKTNWEPLHGRTVLVWPDADEPGRSAASKIKRILPQAGILEISNKPDGWDIADAKEEGNDILQFIRDCARVQEKSREQVAQETRQVLDEIIKILEKYIVLPEYAAEIMAVYILQTYLMDLAMYAPMLIITSPEKRCGKTTLLNILEELVFNPRQFSNITPAAMFRLIEKEAPTLLIDEVDTLLKQKSEMAETLRGIVNAGHRKGRSSTVIRAIKDNSDEYKEYNVFCPKILSGIGKVYETWIDRGISIKLRRKTSSDYTVSRFRQTTAQESLDQLRSRIEHVTEQLRISIDPNTDTKFPEDYLHDRACDNFELMFQICDFIGGGWETKIREAAIAVTNNEEEDSIGVELLKDIFQIFVEEQNPKSIFTETLLERLNGLEDRPWATYNNTRPLTARNLSRLLKPYDITPVTISIGNEKKKGYKAEHFQDAFERYVYIPKRSVTPLPEDTNSLQNKELSGNGNGNGSRIQTLPQEPKENETEKTEDGYGYKSYPLFDPLPSNSLHSKEITPKSNGVTDKTANSECSSEYSDEEILKQDCVLVDES